MQDPRRGPFSQMSGGGAPNAPRPGTGMGNVPFAKGMMSGQFGPPPGRSASPPSAPPVSPPSGEQRPGAPSPPGGPGGAGPAGPPPPGPGQQNPYLDPLFYFDILGALMAALVDASKSDTLFGY